MNDLDWVEGWEDLDGQKFEEVEEAESGRGKEEGWERERAGGEGEESMRGRELGRTAEVPVFLLVHVSRIVEDFYFLIPRRDIQ